MWAKVTVFALFAIIAWANADDVEQEAANSTLETWYEEDVLLYDNVGNKGRVILGQPAQRKQLPWHALISVESGAQYSTGRLIAGSLISSTFVLTEANALRGARAFEIILGAHDRNDRRNVRRSTRAILHPRHVAGEGNWNVGLLKLDRAFTAFTKHVRPVQLAAGEGDYTGRYAWVSGFGSSTNSQFDIVQWATVRVLKDEECQEAFPGVNKETYCTVGHDAYHAGPGIGDGGAPLVALERGTYVQFGVYAFSWRNDFRRPSGYINVASIRPWIRAVSRV